MSINHEICVENLFTRWHVFFFLAFFHPLHLVQTWSVSSESLLAESLTRGGFFGVLGWSTNPSLWLLSDEQRLGPFPVLSLHIGSAIFLWGAEQNGCLSCSRGRRGGSWKLHTGMPAPSRCRATVQAKFQTRAIRFGPRTRSRRDVCSEPVDSAASPRPPAAYYLFKASSSVLYGCTPWDCLHLCLKLTEGNINILADHIIYRRLSNYFHEVIFSGAQKRSKSWLLFWQAFFCLFVGHHPG